LKAVKWISVVTLVAATVFGSQLASYGVMVRFALTLGAIIVMSDAVNCRHYTFATVFGTLALLYNPLVPVVNFSGFWQCAFMILSAILFIASLALPRLRLARYDYRCDVGVYPESKQTRFSLIGVPKEDGRLEKKPLSVAGE
jgi:hypothetical protein